MSDPKHNIPPEMPDAPELHESAFEQAIIDNLQLCGETGENLSWRPSDSGRAKTAGRTPSAPRIT